MNKRAAVQLTLQKMKMTYPYASYYLKFKDPLQLLVGALLSPKVKDETVSKVLPRLFTKYKTSMDYATAPINQLAKDILPVSFANVKARRLKEVSKIILRRCDGRVPDTMEELLSLPGIGRKTANTILVNAFGKIQGIPVDTNVVRVSYRLGWTSSKDAYKIESELMEIVPKRYWGILPYWMKEHGRRICKPRNPLCEKCFLYELCKRQGLKQA